MDVLTRERAKPALPFAGVYQLVDFPLSNLAHSGISEVWLSVQYQGATLEQQVGNGRPWDLDRSRGGFRLLMPQQGSGSLDEDGFAQGNADELFRIRDEIASHGADVVLVMSADHVYRLDYNEVIDRHLRSGAECTVVTTEVDPAEAGDHAVVQVVDGAVSRLDDKPDAPEGTTVAAEIFVYDRAVLVEVLEELHRELGPASPEGDTGLGDFGGHLVPRMVARGRTVAHPLPGYWRDLGQPHLYLAAHRELVTDDHDVLDVPGWPILTRQPQRAPARLLEGAMVVDSMVAPGCRVAGTVRRSVLGPGVTVEAGAEINDSVVFGDTVVEGGARVDHTIVDSGCTLGRDAVVGSPDASVEHTSEEITIVGRGSSVGPGARLAAGARLEPGTSA